MTRLTAHLSYIAQPVEITIHTWSIINPSDQCHGNQLASPVLQIYIQTKTWPFPISTLVTVSIIFKIAQVKSEMSPASMQLGHETHLLETPLSLL